MTPSRRGALTAIAGGALPLIAAEIPRPAPELVIKLATGEDLLLSRFRGKVVALEFILTTCQHCQRSAQVLSRLHQELGARGFQPLGMAINEMSHILVPDFVRDFRITYPVGYGHRDTAVSFLQHSVIMNLMMPQLAFIDRKGVIRAQYPGGDPFYKDEEKNMRETALSLLNESSAPSAKTPPKTSASRSR